MIRVEAVGDWMVIRGDSTWVSTSNRYSLEFDAHGGRGKLHIQPSSDPTDDRIELSFDWPSSERGHLLLADHNQPQRVERLGVVRMPTVVLVSATGEDSKPVEFSGFQLFSVPDEPTQRVLPVEQVTFALRDGGELAGRIENGREATPAPRDLAELGRQLSERIRAAHPEARVEVSDATLSFESSEGARQNISLENAWTRVQSGESDVIEQYLELVAEDTGASNDAQRIFPLLKAAGTAAEFFADARRLAARDGGNPEPPLSTPVTDGLECLYVFDRPRGMQFITASALRGAGLSAEELPAHAVERLNESLTTILRIEVQPGVHMLTCGGNYEVSLLLLPEVWAEVDALLDGQRVVSIPNRDLLFVTGSNNRKGLEWMRQDAGEGPSRSYPIISDLLVWNGSRYEVLPPPKKGWLRRLLQ